MPYSGGRVRRPVAGTTVVAKEWWVGTLTWKLDHLLFRTAEFAAGTGIDRWRAAVHTRLTFTDPRRGPRTRSLLHKTWGTQRGSWKGEGKPRVGIQCTQGPSTMKVRCPMTLWETGQLALWASPQFS